MVNMKKLKDEDIDFFHRYGYLILRNAIDTRPIEQLMEAIAHVIRLESGSSSCDEEVLNQELISLKKRSPSSSSWIYQTLQSSWALKKFFAEIDIIEFVQALLGMDDIKNLGTVSPALRFDIPGDTQNVRTWHQDSNYFLENGAGCDHLVTWIPLNAATRENGSVLIAPETHKDGRLPRKYVEAEGFTSEQYTSAADHWDSKNVTVIEAKPGDIAFIHMDLVHSSGVNITEDCVRYTAQIRFNTINRSDYRPVFLRAEYPEYVRSTLAST